jgi:predicted secreted protein
MEAVMAPNEWIARRTVWGSPSPVWPVSESRPALDAEHEARVPHARTPRSPLERLLGADAINDGAGMIHLDVPHIVTRDTDVPVSVQVNWGLVLAKAVARLYLIADGNRDPLLASIPLIPDVVPPHVCMNVRLDDTCDVRAVVKCGDGTLLEVKRWVWVMPTDLEAAEHDSENL